MVYAIGLFYPVFCVTHDENRDAKDHVLSVEQNRGYMAQD